jgi:hypothetical protein
LEIFQSDSHFFELGNLRVFRRRLLSRLPFVLELNEDSFNGWRLEESRPDVLRRLWGGIPIVLLDRFAKQACNEDGDRLSDIFQSRLFLEPFNPGLDGARNRGQRGELAILFRLCDGIEGNFIVRHNMYFFTDTRYPITVI